MLETLDRTNRRGARDRARGPRGRTAIMGALLLTLPALAGAQIETAPAEEGAGPWTEEAPPLVKLERFFRDPEYASARISPDGDRVAFLRPYEGAMNIHVVARGEPVEQAQPVTTEERSVSGFFWSRDGEYLLYARDADGDEDFEIRALQAPVEPEPEAGEYPESRHLAGGDGVRARIFHVPREAPGELFVGLNDRDPRLHDVYRVDIASGERELVAENTAEIEGWHFHEGELRKATRTTGDGGSEILRVDGEDDFRQIYACEFGESCSLAGFHADGARLYLRTNAGEDRDLSELVLFDPESGEETRVHRDPEGEVDLGRALFSDEDHRLLATQYTGDRQRIYAHDEEFEQALDWLRSELGDAELSFSSWTRDEDVWTVGVQRDVDPGSAWVADLRERELERLYRTRPDLPEDVLAYMEPIRYEARDGTEIPGYLTLPRGAEAEDLPLVVMPHGGPWVRDTWGYSGQVQFLANRGYAVLQPNFRGSSGFGKAFLNAGNQEWGTGVMQHDVTDGVKHLIDEGIADPDRVAIYGGSYGGYATLAGLTWTPELYAAGVSMVGPSSLITLMESIPPYWEAGIKRMHGRVGDPDDPEDRERLKEQSPLFHVDRIESPLLVAQGANDPRVKQAESDQIVAALRDAGHPVEYLLALDEGHGFVNETNRLAFFAGLEGFLAEHVGGRRQAEYPEPVQERLELLRQGIDEVEAP
ncbi:S9 family peptidase [Thioalkalivibrio sp. ALgr3]|uniref:S9 family peptidase n=1 Tax=Thioalkalivibrio sp. ALgr3 TaxID=1239292 RepID=UPI000376CFAD|nr:S9 family peptidase [Thioalkalivibrio sp. ALgr3]